jgi:carbonic anhydrase
MVKSLKASGMQSILNGFLRYRVRERNSTIKQLELVSNQPKPQGVLVTCVDSRIVSSRITSTAPGETLVNRNPGNLVPNYSLLDPKTERPEEAALELACIYNDVDTIVICGHSDCKAMNLVYENRYELLENKSKAADVLKTTGKESVLKSWLMSNSSATVNKFAELEKSNFKMPLNFSITDTQHFQAFIDPDNDFDFNDKFSQVNTLTQLENLKHYKFIRLLLDSNKISAYALWFDIYCGDVYCFSFVEKRFVKLDDESYDRLITNLYNRLGITIIPNF